MRFLILALILALILPPAICKAAFPDRAADQLVNGSINEAYTPPLPKPSSREAGQPTASPASGIHTPQAYTVGTGVDGEDIPSEDECRRGIHAQPPTTPPRPRAPHHQPTSPSSGCLSCTGAATASHLGPSRQPGRPGRHLLAPARIRHPVCGRQRPGLLRCHERLHLPLRRSL